ncbi:MAG: helix-turn-helix transcriptional regulator [Clostridia bacterium]|nr:helix-turn-helix transcriptional regulator [Clostridia bacterium]MDY5219973.1 helix-turn-helix transcriptional regulator [Eubacteriales bacterium]
MQKIRQDANIGRKIRELRIQAHMTQEQVVAKLQLAGCDISRSIYSQIEGGDYNIRVTELVALKQLFGVDYNAFFAGLEE